MLEELINRYPVLQECSESIENARIALISSYTNGGKLLLCGNGGSCADCEHITGELMKGFLKKRPLSKNKRFNMKKKYPEINPLYLEKLQDTLPAISLTDLTGLNTAFCNDVDPLMVYAQGVIGLGCEEDALMCISTSGNSGNVCAAAEVARACGLTVIGMTGKTGGKLKDIADISICVPELETYKVQELHLPVYHYLCAALEEQFFES